MYNRQRIFYTQRGLLKYCQKANNFHDQLLYIYFTDMHDITMEFFGQKEKQLKEKNSWRNLQNKWFLLPNVILSVAGAILVNSQSFLLIRLGLIQNLSWFGVFSFCFNALVFLILSDQVKLFYKLWKSEKGDESEDEAILNVWSL